MKLIYRVTLGLGRGQASLEIRGCCFFPSLHHYFDDWHPIPRALLLHKAPGVYLHPPLSAPDTPSHPARLQSLYIPPLLIPGDCTDPEPFTCLTPGLSSGHR